MTGLLASVDAGATKVRAALASADGRRVFRVEGPGANAALAGPEVAAAAIAAVLRPTLRGHPLSSLAVGIAGAWSPRLSARVARHLRASLGCRRVVVRNDAVAVLEGLAPRANAILLSVGTGAVAVGRTRDGRLVRADGWGPLAGDAGSGHWIGRRALEAALAAHDGRGRPTAFTRAVLKTLNLRHPADDIHQLYAPPPLSRFAGEGRVRASLAALAPLTLRFARHGDPAARGIIRAARRELAATLAAVRRRMPPGPLKVWAAGGLAAPLLPSLPAPPLSPDAAFLLLAFRVSGLDGLTAAKRAAQLRPRRISSTSERGLPDTERTNPATASFSRLPPLAMLRLMNAEDAKVAPAVGVILHRIADAVTAVERRLRAGGRLIYAGAGTSGRLGVLDASEIPPTFGVSPHVVQAVMAGGRRAVTSSVEGAEDRPDQGAAAIRRLRVNRRDAVVGLSASGGARFVLGAIAEAKRRGAATIGVTCVPRSPLARAVRLPLVVRTGPEAVAGSTRLKAGTAQKLVLNMLSTCVFARLGRIEENFMPHVVPANAKLRHRRARIRNELLRELGYVPIIGR